MYTFSVIKSSFDQTDKLINIVRALNLNIVGNIILLLIIKYSIYNQWYYIVLW